MNTVQQTLQGDCGDRESEGAILQSLLRHRICQAISLSRSGQVVEDRTVILVRVDMRGKNSIGPGDIWPDFIEGCKGRDSREVTHKVNHRLAVHTDCLTALNLRGRVSRKYKRDVF